MSENFNTIKIFMFGFISNIFAFVSIDIIEGALKFITTILAVIISVLTIRSLIKGNKIKDLKKKSLEEEIKIKEKLLDNSK